MDAGAGEESIVVVAPNFMELAAKFGFGTTPSEDDNLNS
jgi:hypothetical protein